MHFVERRIKLGVGRPTIVVVANELFRAALLSAPAEKLAQVAYLKGSLSVPLLNVSDHRGVVLHYCMLELVFHVANKLQY